MRHISNQSFTVPALILSAPLSLKSGRALNSNFRYSCVTLVCDGVAVLYFDETGITSQE